MKKYIQPVWIAATLWRVGVVHVGLMVFAGIVVFDFAVSWVTGKISSIIGVEILLLAVGVFGCSFLIYKLRPHKFLRWERLKNMDLLKPPLSNLLMSVALSYFLISLLRKDDIPYWGRGGLISEDIYQSIALFSVAVPLFFILFFFICIVVPMKVFELLPKEYRFKRLFIFLYISFLLVAVIGVQADLFDRVLTSYLQLFVPYTNQIIWLFSITMGFIPIGWAYELFVGSIAKGKSNLFGTLLGGKIHRRANISVVRNHHSK